MALHLLLILTQGSHTYSYTLGVTHNSYQLEPLSGTFLLFFPKTSFPFAISLATVGVGEEDLVV